MRVLGPLTISSLVGREVEDQRSLTLAGAPAYVARHGHDDGEVSYAVVPGADLGRRALMDLLYVLAPYKAHGPDRFARVLDNWGLHDRAKTSAGSENLLLQHARSLKLSWHEFSRHRELFVSVLKDETEMTRILPIVTWKRTAGGARRWQFDDLDSDLVQALQESVPMLRRLGGQDRSRLDSLAGLVTIAYFQPELHRKWRAWLPLEKNGKSNYVGPASVPVVALMHRRALLNSALVRRAEASVDSTTGVAPETPFE